MKGLEIIGLVVSAAHDCYEMYVRLASLEQEILGPFFVICDRVAKSFQKSQDGVYRIVAAQKLSPSKKRGREMSIG